MKKKLFIILLILTFSLAEEVFSQQPFWTVGTAFTVPAKHTEISLFRPSSYGVSKKAEISLHPVAFFVMPHLFYKRRWTAIHFGKRAFFVSSRHGLYYPTFALNLTKKYTFGYFLPISTSVPYSLATQHELLVSHYLNPPSHCDAGNYLLTGRLGFKYSYGIGASSPPIIYKSVLYRETMVFNPKLVWYTGIDLDAHLNSTFNYFVDLDFYSVGMFENIAIESKAGIMGYSGTKWSAFGGIKVAFSTMPGQNKLMFIPVFDVTYHWRVKAKQKYQKGLFGRKKRFHFFDNSAKGDVNDILDKLDDNSDKKGK